MNPTKSFLGVSSGKFLGFIVHQKEFISTQTRSKLFRACIHLRISKNLGVCKVDWHISEDSSQISQAAINHSPTHEKGCFFCMGSSLSRYLTKPPVLVAPTSGKPFLLYVKVMDHSLVLYLPKKMIMVTNKLFII